MPKPPHNIITIYGRKPVLEALQQYDLDIFRVHLADSNKASGIIADIESACSKRKIDIQYHDRLALSRISKNKKQDQGVAADIINPKAIDFQNYIEDCKPNARLLAVDRITNPQNLGMIIRTVTASTLDGILIPKNGCAKLDALVVKASAGTVFRSRLIFCERLEDTLVKAKQKGFAIYGMALEGARSFYETTLKEPSIVILGNETDGLSEQVKNCCDQLLYIPMQNGVESLNVSVTAGILAFHQN